MFGNVGAAADVVRRLQGDKHCGSVLQRRTTNLCQASLSITANICSLVAYLPTYFDDKYTAHKACYQERGDGEEGREKEEIGGKRRGM